MTGKKDEYGQPLDKDWREVRFVTDAGEKLNLMDWQSRLQKEIGLMRLKLRSIMLSPLSIFPDLSDLERSIARLAIRGMTNKEIGKELDLSPSTIGTKIYRMRKKTGLSKAGLIRHFYKSLEDLLQDPTGGTKE